MAVSTLRAGLCLALLRRPAFRSGGEEAPDSIDDRVFAKGHGSELTPQFTRVDDAISPDSRPYARFHLITQQLERPLK